MKRKITERSVYEHDGHYNPRKTVWGKVKFLVDRDFKLVPKFNIDKYEKFLGVSD